MINLELLQSNEDVTKNVHKIIAAFVGVVQNIRKHGPTGRVYNVILAILIVIIIASTLPETITQGIPQHQTVVVPSISPTSPAASPPSPSAFSPPTLSPQSTSPYTLSPLSPLSPPSPSSLSPTLASSFDLPDISPTPPPPTSVVASGTGTSSYSSLPSFTLSGSASLPVVLLPSTQSSPFGVPWSERVAAIRKDSPFGHLPNWCIVC